jgi:3-isopropylmalate/(R)-2-methylmalate dehydratase large subunit
MTARTLYDKLWDDHVVHTEDDGTDLLYIDRHLVHEVTSPQAFEGLRLADRKPWRVSSIVATADHNTPTTGWEQGYDGITDPVSRSRSSRWTPTSRPSARRRTFRSWTSARASCT